MFKIKTNYKPSGDQPQAISLLLKNFKENIKEQILLGATGTGKTFTIANIIQKLNKKTLVIAPNKTLAGQLYSELKEIFPLNKVEYFISYYDYYQPESYVVASDTYIEKDASINDEIDQLRHSAAGSLINYEDVIVVASVSCIYGIGDVNDYQKATYHFKKGDKIKRDFLIKKLIELQYKRNDYNFVRGSFRIRGDIIEIIPISHKEKGFRIIFLDDNIEIIQSFNVLNGKLLEKLNFLTIFPASLYNIDRDKIKESIRRIKDELESQIQYFKSKNCFLEAQRIENKTRYDLEMLQEIGHCNGIENYYRHLSLKEKDIPLSTLIDFFGHDFLTIIDESHVTIPQIRGMYFGDKSRKENLVTYGFRLPSALDNRPLKFHEFEEKIDKIVYLSATPGDYELSKNIPIVEQLIRPTFLLDPIVEIRKTKHQIDDIYLEIQKRIKLKERVLITTLTINMSEDLTAYLKDLDIKVGFLHSKIKSLERLKILKDLRIGKYDCLVGVNLLREGLDLPEVSLMIILDADKQGFLRNDRSLIQTIGRVARNINGKVIMYADKISNSMYKAIEETKRRRTLQEEYNKKNKLVPLTINKNIYEEISLQTDIKKNYSNLFKIDDIKNDNQNVEKKIKKIENLMKIEAKKMNFERAAELRDIIIELRKNFSIKK